MKKLFSLAAILFLALNFSLSSHAQKEEIKAFQEMNKDLLKTVRKQFKQDPKVEYDNGNFFIVVEGKVNKVKKKMLLNEEGTVLTPEPVSGYSTIDKNYVTVYQQYGDKSLFGAVNYKTGDQILEPKYTQITVNYKTAAGKNKKGIWHPALTDSWIAYDEDSNLTYIFSGDGKNLLNKMPGSYTIIGERYAKIGSNNANGLYDLNGNEIYPQRYKDFEIAKDGFIITKRLNGTTFYGGKTINPELPRYVINDDVLAVKWDNGTPYYKVHKDDEWIDFSKNPTYTVEYIDDGQKYYDFGDNDKVIAYYEGEGMDAPHGGYYMGLAAKNIADVELAKLEWTISTLNNPKTYYYPVKWPEKYTFNSMLLGGQYITAIDYFDRFLKNSDVDSDDPKIKLAKKYRGEAAVSKTKVARKVEEYTEAYTAASKKYATEQHNAAVRQANEKALSNSIATGIANILFGK